MNLDYDPLPKSRDAARWSNSAYTHSHHLFAALSFFIETGWGPEALDEFIEGIMPVCGWSETWKPHDMKQEYRRPRTGYSHAVHAMQQGYWQPKGKK